MRDSTDQSNSEYGHFLRNPETHFIPHHNNVFWAGFPLITLTGFPLNLVQCTEQMPTTQVSTSQQPLQI